MSRETDKSIERRRCVSAFLDGMKKLQNDNDCDEDYCGGDADLQKDRLDSDTNKSMLGNDVGTIPRKNVEDVHSTYRIGSDCNNTGKGQWHRIPTLLLVEGDFIALKVGDTAPAKCRPLSLSPLSSSLDNGIIEAGERLTAQSLPQEIKETLVFNDTSTPKAAKNATARSSGGMLPLGRHSVRYHSNFSGSANRGIPIISLYWLLKILY